MAPWPWLVGNKLLVAILALGTSMTEGWSYNVALNIIYSGVSAVGSSIVSGALILSAYVYYLDGGANSNEDVGYVSATAGATMVALAIPVGLLTDKYPRHTVLKVAAVAGVVAAGTMFMALYKDSMLWLYISSGLYGVSSAVTGAPLNSLFADSIASGNRTRLYAIQYGISCLAGAVGPAIALFFFLYMGNEWTTRPLRAVSSNPLATCHPQRTCRSCRR